MNPWWEGKPGRLLPKTRRHLVSTIHARLQSRLAPIVAVRGPRQIGKTTAQMHVIDDLLAKGVRANRILRVQFDELESLEDLDEPILRITEGFERAILQQTLNEAARAGEPAYLFFDEVQNLRRWAEQLKHLVDSSTAHAIVTGSSALRIELGRDSLAGRVTTIEAGVLSLTEIASFRDQSLGMPFLKDNGLDVLTVAEFWRSLAAEGRTRQLARDEAFKWFSLRGGYPLAHERTNIEWPAIADQLNETVIRRVIQHDLRIGERGRKRDPALLEELFRLCCRYVGSAPDARTLARELERALKANVGPDRVRHYARFLRDTLLIRLIEPLELRMKRRRASDKICLADHALRAAWLQEVIPLDPHGLSDAPHLTDLAGHIAESIVGATLSTISNLDLSWYPAREDSPEIDFVMTIGTRRIPIEVKYRRKIDPLRDTEGLRTFMERTVNNAPFGLLITLEDTHLDPRDPRIIEIPLSSLMLLR